MNKLKVILIGLLSGVLSFPIMADETAKNATKTDPQVITIETATIRGNQELPTVLYLVPWQPPEINPLDASQTADMTKHSIELINRQSFTRLLEYHGGFKTR